MEGESPALSVLWIYEIEDMVHGMKKTRENLGEQLRSVCTKAVCFANKLGNEEKRSILCVLYQ